MAATVQVLQSTDPEKIIVITPYHPGVVDAMRKLMGKFSDSIRTPEGYRKGWIVSAEHRDRVNEVLRQFFPPAAEKVESIVTWEGKEREGPPVLDGTRVLFMDSPQKVRHVDIIEVLENTLSAGGSRNHPKLWGRLVVRARIRPGSKPGWEDGGGSTKVERVRGTDWDQWAARRGYERPDKFKQASFMGELTAGEQRQMAMFNPSPRGRGTYLDQERVPKWYSTAWIRGGWDGTTLIKGTVDEVKNDPTTPGNSHLPLAGVVVGLRVGGNTLYSGGQVIYVPLRELYDHKPRMVKWVPGSYFGGDKKIWENPSRQRRGSYLDQGHLPSVGTAVWIRAGWEGKTVLKGTVRAVYDIDQRGLANTYVDVDTAQGSKHINLGLVYDHRPRQVEITDAYGATRVWENPSRHQCPACHNPVLVQRNAVAVGCPGCGAVLGVRHSEVV